MKAIRLHARGGPEQLIYEDAPEPALKNGDALVHVHACAITPTELTWAETYTTCDGAGRLPSIPSHEVSGVVAARGANAADANVANVGDHVYALTDFSRDGAAAEYLAVHSADLAPKPASLSDVQAAAVPLAALTAWQALFDHAGLVPGQEILIHGATGGVGSFAVQLARWRGAYVVATASAANAELACELGADKVIDYNAVRFEDKVREADVVLDTVGGDTLKRSWGVLRRGGVLVTIVASPPADKAARYGVRGLFFIVKPSRAQLIEIGRLIDRGKLRPIIEATFPLEEARQAFERAAGGHNRGKIVLQVRGETAADTGTQADERAA
jgi:NADPH:quinone reductase-like Zn-dependent oxidoreductase